MKPRNDNLPQKMRAHDVRHLTFCNFCGGLGDRRDMIAEPGIHTHTSCFAENVDPQTLAALPASERGKFRLCDLTDKHIAALVSHAADVAKR